MTVSSSEEASSSAIGGPDASATSPRKLISFAIAVYRNEGALEETWSQIRTLFQTRLTGYDYEIVFVDDGSDDGSLAEIESICARDHRVKALSFTRNFGQMAAMMAGFHAASGDAIVNISADMQDPVELVEQMAEQWSAGAEIVICHREQREDGLVRRVQSNVAYGIIRLSIPQVPKGGFDYVLMDRRVMDEFNNIPARNRFFQGDLLWLGYRTALIPYVRRERKVGKSQYNFWKKFRNLTDALLDASYLPIRFISFCGVVTAFGGFLYGFSVVLAWLFGITPFRGWAALMIVTVVIGGMMMLMLGIIGEYVWRIFDEVRGKPIYVVRERLGAFRTDQHLTQEDDKPCQSARSTAD